MPPTLEPDEPDYRRAAAGRAAGAPNLDWLDPLKAFALMGVLLNHLVEEFGRSPWFTNPSRTWPSLEERLRTFFPVEDPLWIALPRFLGWLGDAGPGVFIFASGLGLAYALGNSPRKGAGWIPGFYSRRLTKLFPAYWGAHLLIAGLAVVVPVALVNLGTRDSLLSLTGIRLTPGAFFHINPSWWFVWTVLQLYLLFPLLVLVRDRLGINALLAASLVVTIAARGIGLLLVEDLYYWMTGLCGLTRLAEFVLGMWAASILIRNDGWLPNRLSTVFGALAPGLVIYAAGLLCSAFLPTTMISNLVVTAGLSLVFLGLWHAARSASPSFARSLSWVGANAYGAYLIHQPLLKWAVQLGIPYGTAVALPAAIAVIVASVPVGASLERNSTRAQAWLSQPGPGPRRAGIAVAACLLVILLLVDPLLQTWFGRTRAAVQVVLVAGFLTLVVIEIASRARRLAGSAWVRWWALVATFAGIWLAPPGEADFAAVAALPAAALAWLAARRHSVKSARALLVVCIAVAMLAAAEGAFRKLLPIETPVAWGELPALTLHPTQTYALQRARTVRLRYNNYDYLVETNKEGLNGPEILERRPTPDTLRILIVGNAFTMPEGLPWRSAYPALIEARLGACLKPRVVQVINGGVTGYSPTEKLPALRELAQKYRPDIFIDQFFMTEFRWMMQSPEERLQEIGLKVRDGSRIARVWSSMQLPNQWRRLRRSVVEAISVTPSEWRFGKALLPYYRVDDARIYTPETARRLARYYGELRSLAATTGAKALVLYVPGAVEVQPTDTLSYFPRSESLDDPDRYDLERPYRFLSDAAAPSQLPLYSLRPALKAAAADRPYFSASWHWTDVGHRIAAAEVVDWLANSGAVPVACRHGGGLE